MKVDLPAHPIDLRVDRAGQVFTARPRRTFGFVDQHGEWGLQAMREVASLCLRSGDRALLIREQGIDRAPFLPASRSVSVYPTHLALL